MNSKILFVTQKSIDSLLMRFDFYINQTNSFIFHFTHLQKKSNHILKDDELNRLGIFKNVRQPEINQDFGFIVCMYFTKSNTSFS